MKTTAYQQAKDQLKEIARIVRRTDPHDKPAQRQTLNDCADTICKDFNLSEAQRDRLSNFVCSLHPKE